MSGATAPAGADDRSRQSRGDQRRQQILDAAVELFAERGFRGTGVAALAKRVGMTATGMLYYFGTKERLLHEVVAERDRSELSSVAADLTLDDLRRIGADNEASAELTRLYVVLGAENLDAGDPLHDFFVDRYARGRRFVADVLAAEMARGRVRADVDVPAVAAEVLAVLMGLEIQWLMDPAAVDLAASVDAYIDRLTDNLGERP